MLRTRGNWELCEFWHVVRLTYKEQFGKKKFRKNPVVLLTSALLSNFVYYVTLGL